jgi:arginase
VYLHVDLDIVDSAELAGLRVPAGSGPALALVADCVAAIASAARVAAAGIACTFLPGRSGDPAARSAIARMGSALGAAGLAQEAARCDQPGR